MGLLKKKLAFLPNLTLAEMYSALTICRLQEVRQCDAYLVQLFVKLLMKQVAVTIALVLPTAFWTWHVAIAYKKITQKDVDAARYSKVKDNFEKITSMLHGLSQEEVNAMTDPPTSSAHGI